MLFFPQRRRRHGALDDVHQLLRGGDRLLGTGGEDCRRDAARIALLPKIPQDPVQSPLIPVIDDLIGRQASGRVHTHIQRRVDAIGKTPLRLIQLRGGHTEVEQHAIHRIEPERSQDRGRVAEIAMNQCYFVAEDG